MSAPATECEGAVAPGFERLRDAFARSVADDLDAGAGLAVSVEGRLVLDLVGGYADRAKTQAVTAETLFAVFSCSKAVSALVVATLVEAGALSYDQTVASLWPEFAQAGKADITVAQALSHQAGLSGVPDEWAPEDWLDAEKAAARLAEMTPMWPPGTATGYHPISWGVLAAEIVRRACGRSLGTVLREDICAPRAIDFWIGLPPSEHARAAELTPPRAVPDFGEINAPTRAAFLERWSSPGRRGAAAWRAAELPAANGHGTARAMARLMEPFAREGRLDETQLLTPQTIAEATRIRIEGPDLVLPHDLAFAPGLIVNRRQARIYGPGARTVGHTGYGGACLFADPDRRLAFGYCVTKQNPTLVDDARLSALIEAVYACV